jgi:hypothetical protein
MMTNEQLIEISRNVDSYLAQLTVKYEIAPLSLAAIIIARTMLFNEEAGSTEDFLKLLNSVVKNPPIHPIESQVH